MTPRRRPPARDFLDVQVTLERAAKAAPEWELGWSELRQKMRDAGWPSRTPDDDRRPSSGQGEPPCIDYADSTGELALRLDDLYGDLEALQDHWNLATTSLAAIGIIARKHMPVAVPSVPTCSVASCDDPVETTPSGGYRGMERIVGIWVAKPGVRPTCGRHRKASAA